METRLAEVTDKKVGETLTDVTGVALVQTLTACLEEVEAKTVGKKLVDRQAEAPVNTLLDTL